VRDPTTLLGSPAPQMPTFENRIPAPLAAPSQPPVINGPSARSPYGGGMEAPQPLPVGPPCRALLTARRRRSLRPACCSFCCWPARTYSCASSRSSGGCRGTSAQDKLKYSAPRIVRSNPQAAIVGLDNGAADRQAHPHPLRFCRKERVEYAVDILRANSCSRVRNRYLYAVVMNFGPHA